MTSRTPTLMIATAAGLTVAVLAICLLVNQHVLTTLAANGRLVEDLHVLRGDILLHDETLTMSAMMAAQSGDTVWIERYRDVEPALDATIERMITLTDTPVVAQAVAATDVANAALVAIETRAFERVEDGLPAEALRLLNSERYAAEKRRYRDGMNSALSVVSNLSRETVANERRIVTLTSRAGLLTLIVLFCLWGSVLHHLRRWNLELGVESSGRQAAEQATRRLNDELEGKVFERTRALAASEARLTHQANIDDLTGLPNRHSGLRQLETMVADATPGGDRVAVASVEIRAFGLVNEGFGHAVGDELLIAMAARLKRTANLSGGFVARLGGDEFLLACRLRDDDSPASLIERIQAVFLDTVTIDADDIPDLRVDSCIGLAMTPDHGRHARLALQKADLAKHMAKKAGRDGAFVFNEGIERDRADRREIERAMRQALDEGQFQLHYQPKFDLASGQAAGAEALLRWTHPELGFVPPDRFIPIAEETGLILEIGDWVLNEAARQIAAWRRDDGLELRVAVNVSSLQLRHGDFVATLRETLARHHLAPDELQIEMTESALLENDTCMRAIVERISELGCELALDDFGTGYSALSYLKFFPFDCLKIDRSFVTGILDSSSDRAVAQAIITMAHSLDMIVVGEGIEQREHGALLTRYGCDLAQGYYFSKPLAAGDLTVFCRGWRPETWRAEVRQPESDGARAG